MKSSEELANEYELYFDKVKWGAFKEDKLTVQEPYEIDRFVRAYHDKLKEFEYALFDNLMRVEWADRKIVYKGRSIATEKGPYGQDFNYALKFFYQRWVKYGKAFFKAGWFRFLRSYADDLFPDFNNLNGLEFYFEFPFKHLILEHLVCVAQMEERMELLKTAEEKQMDLIQFHDYVAAYYSELTVRTGRNFVINWNIQGNSMPFMSEKYSLAQALKRKMLRRKKV